MENEIYTLGEAAEQLSVTRQAIWQAVQRGRIEAIQHKHVCLITKEALDAYRESRRVRRRNTVSTTSRKKR